MPWEIDGDWVRGVLEDFIAHSSHNSLQNPAHEKAFGRPLVGFACGDDPLFEAYKAHVGPFFITPWELFAITFRDSAVRAENLTVISYILPQTEATKADNRKEDTFPAERWARARIFGEKVNEEMRRHLVTALAEQGCRAVAPVLTPQFSRRISPKYGFSSTWSERHAAYACGLGTFGLCDGLITPVGKAMRVGSVVAELRLPPTPRPYTDHHAYCLFYARGTCKKCIDRCPAGAITTAGKDKQLCMQHVIKTAAYVSDTFGFKGYGCGLCQTGVPCESRIPIKTEKER
ncbi:MAG: epoxyqueuosine reductase [Desulfatitalea sp.]|nr:epoxyqueuosine reductase [Desulfatitalea sp.]